VQQLPTTHMLPHWTALLLHWKLHVPVEPRTHVAVPFATDGHGVHMVPHESGLRLGEHELPHAWKLLLQEKPHFVPSQVAVAFGGGVHGVHEEPHVLGFVLSAQTLPHA
jgi:hypothetical protein